METSHDANGHPVLFTEEEFREMLDKQVKHNDTLQQKLDKSQSELKKARERIKEFDNAVAKMPSVDTDPQELLAQVGEKERHAAESCRIGCVDRCTFCWTSLLNCGCFALFAGIVVIWGVVADRPSRQHNHMLATGAGARQG
eukprot:3169115-Rhodomonas_salina.2